MRVAGWSGILFVVLSGFLLLLAPFWPPVGASAESIVAFYTAHRSAFLFGNALAIAAAIPSFVQISVLAMLIKRAEGPAGWLWLAVVAAALVAHGVGALALIAYQAVPFQLGEGQLAVAKGLSDLGGVAFAATIFAMGGFAGFTAWAIKATKVLPAWVGSFGGVTAVVCAACGGIGLLTASVPLLAGGGLVECGALGLFCGWCLAISAVFLQRKNASSFSFTTAGASA